MEDRIQRATQLFKSGYNCSQSVVAAFADIYGFTEEQALRMAASFGGGEKLVAPLAVCFYWQDWKKVRLTVLIRKGRLLIMLWYKNLRLNLRKETVH